MKYGIAVKLKHGISGLTKDEVNELFDLLDDTEAYPIEILSKKHKSSAMGFISKSAANKIEFEYHKDSLLYDVFASKLDDVYNTPYEQKLPTVDYEIDKTHICLVTGFVTEK